jgi:proline utilization trans-activator
MDRQFSASVGAPTIINDNDTTASIDTPPSIPLHAHISPTMKLHVKLFRLHSHILMTIYKETRAQLDSFLEMTRDILHCLAEMAQEIEHIVSLKITNLVDSISKETRNVALLYHQCVIKATRPLLLSVLKDRLESLHRNEDGEDWEDYISKTKPLISEGIKSAIKTVDILSSDETLLQMFLPFDLEYTFGATLHLAMANILFPDLEQENQACFDNMQGLMNRMVRRGNKLALVRKQELSHLDILLSELSKRTSQRGFTTWTINPMQAGPLDDDPIAHEQQHSGPQSAEEMQRDEPNNSPSARALERITYPTPDQTTLSAETAPAPFLGDQSGGSLFAPSPSLPMNSGQDFLASIGISSENFFSIVDQMNQLDNCLNMVAPEL